MRRLLCSVVLAVTAVPLAVGASGATTSGANGILMPAILHQRLPLAGRTIVSSNWSGYVVRSSSRNITREVTTFVVPRESKPPSGFASTWGGVGGVGTSDLIQAGVSEHTTAPRYFAWYEMLPQAEHPITSGCSGISSCRVSPGDSITVRISQASSNRWTISIADSGKWTWSKTFTYDSSRSSAEWILEAPTLDGRQTRLPGLTPATFGPESTFVKGGTTRTIAQGAPIKILLVTASGKREATPSALASDGQSFDSCAWTKSCSAL